MKLRKGNILEITGYIPDHDKELFETLFHANHCKIERIVSSGQVTPIGKWYDQDQDEWVILLQGCAIIEFSDKSQHQLATGDFLFIPAHLRHRVIYTSKEPACIWLAIHGNITL